MHGCESQVETAGEAPSLRSHPDLIRYCETVCRERLGLTQEQFAEKTGLTPNYISTLERGASFPRCEKLILIINALETNADAIFCDVLEHSAQYQASVLSRQLGALPPREQKRILEIMELMIRQATENN